jgi:hypothetical protein
VSLAVKRKKWKKQSSDETLDKLFQLHKTRLTASPSGDGGEIMYNFTATDPVLLYDKNRQDGKEVETRHDGNGIFHGQQAFRHIPTRKVAESTPPYLYCA